MDERFRGFVMTRELMVTAMEGEVSTRRAWGQAYEPGTSRIAGSIQRFWSLRYRAAPSSGLLLTIPMARESA